MKVLSMLLTLRQAQRPFWVAAALGASMLTLPAHATRIKEVAAIQGVRSNQLTGYGLVVGLDGTGDQTTQMPYTKQALANYLEQMGISLPATGNAGQLQLKNVAAVIVTAELPAFAQPGQTIDVVVSSVGNAKSLKGGTLVTTPLRVPTARSTRWPRATSWSAALAPRPAAPRYRSTT